MGVWTGFIWLEDRDMWRELVNVVMSITFGEFLDQLRTG
jgi:hypothetical protein